MTKNNTVTRNLFMDGDAVFEQVTSYDPRSDEATIIVPPHNPKAFSSNSSGSSRKGVRIIMTKTKMFTITDSVCNCEDLPDHINFEHFKIPQTSTHRDADAAASGKKFLLKKSCKYKCLI